MKKFLKKLSQEFCTYCWTISSMNLHDKNISDSIDKNIIGTCNLVKICKKYNVKIIYFSTSYVYQGIKGNYSETDPVLPINNYAWSKLEVNVVQMYKNSLI